MSITMAFCGVCKEGSLEGHPPMFFCEKCFLQFHRRCGIEVPVGAKDCEEIPSIHCPKYQGGHIDPRDEGLITGYCLALAAATVRHLDAAIIEPLFDATKSLYGTLDLPSIRSIDDSAADLLLQRKYKLRVGVTHEKIDHLVEKLPIDSEEEPSQGAGQG